MLTWVQGASIEDLAEAITPFLTAPLEPLTETSAEGLIEGWRDLQEVRDDAADLVSPAPVATPEVETADILDAGLIKMAGLERRYARKLPSTVHCGWAHGWTSRNGARAALRFMVATDPAIETGSGRRVPDPGRRRGVRSRLASRGGSTRYASQRGGAGTRW